MIPAWLAWVIALVVWAWIGAVYLLAVSYAMRRATPPWQTWTILLVAPLCVAGPVAGAAVVVA